MYCALPAQDKRSTLYLFHCHSQSSVCPVPVLPDDDLKRTWKLSDLKLTSLFFTKQSRFSSSGNTLLSLSLSHRQSFQISSCVPFRRGRCKHDGGRGNRNFTLTPRPHTCPLCQSHPPTFTVKRRKDKCPHLSFLTQAHHWMNQHFMVRFNHWFVSFTRVIHSDSCFAHPSITNQGNRKESCCFDVCVMMCK
jgi:hypothetical protein